jgi:hypothetical protein
MNNENNGISVTLATIATTTVITIFSLNQSLYGILYPGILQYIENFDYENINLAQFLNIRNIFIAIIVFLEYKFKISEYLLETIQNLCKPKNDKYIMLNIYSDQEIRTFIDYIAFFPEHYSIPEEVEFGNPELFITSREYMRSIELTEMANYRKAADDVKVVFEDKNFNIKGFFYWRKKTVLVEKDKNQKALNLPYVELSVEKKKDTNVSLYFADMEKKCEEMREKTQRLFHVKVLKDSDGILNNEYLLYSGDKRKTEDLEGLYIDSYFHPEKSRMWKKIKAVHFSPEVFFKFGQSPRESLLLYGPPGTGKSTFAYRISVTLGRHIISLDLRSIKNKDTIYGIMRKPTVNGYCVQPNEVVFVFDEFDLTVMELYYKKRKMSNIVENWIEYMSSSKKKKSKDGEKDKNEPGADKTIAQPEQ